MTTLWRGSNPIHTHWSPYRAASFSSAERCASFFDKRPEFIQLAFLHVIVLDEMLADFFAMASSGFKYERHCLGVNVKDPGAGTNAVAFGQRLQDTIDALFICVKAGKDTCVARAKFSATFQTTIERSAVRTIETHQLEMAPNGFASIGTRQHRS